MPTTGKTRFYPFSVEDVGPIFVCFLLSTRDRCLIFPLQWLWKSTTEPLNQILTLLCSSKILRSTQDVELDPFPLSDPYLSRSTKTLSATLLSGVGGRSPPLTLLVPSSRPQYPLVFSIVGSSWLCTVPGKTTEYTGLNKGGVVSGHYIHGNKRVTSLFVWFQVVPNYWSCHRVSIVHCLVPSDQGREYEPSWVHTCGSSNLGP